MGANLPRLQLRRGAPGFSTQELVVLSPGTPLRQLRYYLLGGHLPIKSVMDTSHSKAFYSGSLLKGSKLEATQSAEHQPLFSAVFESRVPRSSCSSPSLSQT